MQGPTNISRVRHKWVGVIPINVIQAWDPIIAVINVDIAGSLGTVCGIKRSGHVTAEIVPSGNAVNMVWGNARADKRIRSLERKRGTLERKFSSIKSLHYCSASQEDGDVMARQHLEVWGASQFQARPLRKGVCQESTEGWEDNERCVHSPESKGKTLYMALSIVKSATY